LKARHRNIAIVGSFLLVGLFVAVLFFFTTGDRVLLLGEPRYARETVPVATWQIPERSRFWKVESITNQASLLLREGDRWRRKEGVRRIRWDANRGFQIVANIPDHPWKVELRSVVVWKLVLGRFSFAFPPKTRIWRSQELPPRSHVEKAKLEPLIGEFE
jgi:hypothetical protein